jgi:predicted RNA methylase
MANYKLTPEVEDVLRRSTITESSVALPNQLERKLYEDVNKVLVHAGGKWNRGAKAHVFASDPRVKLGLALETGVSVDEKKLYQEFFTPPDLADTLAVTAGVGGMTVLEPSAGAGAIALACRKFGAKEVVCVELQRVHAERLKSLGFQTYERDFLSIGAGPVGLFDRVVMNPPFTKGQDLRHIEHAKKFLKPGGRLVSVISGNTERQTLKDLVDAWGGTIGRLDDGAFKGSGTMVRTAFVALRKPE